MGRCQATFISGGSHGVAWHRWRRQSASSTQENYGSEIIRARICGMVWYGDVPAAAAADVDAPHKRPSVYARSSRVGSCTVYSQL